MTIGRSLCIGLGLAALAGAAPAAANDIPPMTRQQMLERADLVVLATREQCFEPAPHDAYCRDRMRVVATIKGGGEVFAFTLGQSGAAEDSGTDCCRPGRLYLMYLSGGDGRYMSVRGTFGVVDVTQAPIAPEG